MVTATSSGPNDELASMEKRQSTGAPHSPLLCPSADIGGYTFDKGRHKRKKKKHRKIHIRQSKTDQFGTGATIYLARESWFDEILLRQINASPPGQLLCTANGTQWSEGAAATEIRRLCEKAGIRKLSPHAFRRGGTTRALEEGVPMELVQRRGRWASPRSMKPYIAHTATTQGGPADLIG
ncbi:site-specific recombinase, phage integrase family [Ancylostoma ceylanicum]|uniref:Site-specific recombinase, phage integrase family n=1 Tax=Ancylostoma ceylanicum TaxID=53326 RepID=A0A0D6LTV8_9BILA|nr:site-specific recombinase, phage integrase family [Ancylostoma ceylanicum]